MSAVMSMAPRVTIRQITKARRRQRAYSGRPTPESSRDRTTPACMTAESTAFRCFSRVPASAILLNDVMQC